MRTNFLILAFALFVTVHGYGQDTGNLPSSQLDAATAYTFTGKIVFIQKDTKVVYDLTVTRGQVSGYQYWPGEAKPVGQIVGGWFDFDQGQLSLLIQGADHVRANLRSQLQQFHLDIDTKEVKMEHALYSYGLTTENTDFSTAHTLMVLDRVGEKVEHLVK